MFVSLRKPVICRSSTVSRPSFRASRIALQLGSVETRPMTLQQARQQFDAGKFYSMLPRWRQA